MKVKVQFEFETGDLRLCGGCKFRRIERYPLNPTTMYCTAFDENLLGGMIEGNPTERCLTCTNAAVMD